MRLYGQPSGNGGTSSLLAAIGALRSSYFNKLPVGASVIEKVVRLKSDR
jgi:hypothetical protein